MKTHAAARDSARIEETAADWFVRRRDGLRPEAEAEYQAWVAANPQHAAAMAELEATWATVSFPSAANRRREAALLLERWAASRRRRVVTAVGGLAVAAMLVIAFVPLRFPSDAARPRVAVVARPNIERLPDGSTVELNAGAEISVHFTTERRSVRLVRGEAFFSVAKDATRPFVVSTRAVEVRAVGTAFSVRHDAEGVGVLVTEGRVAVETVVSQAARAADPGESPPPVQPIYLDAGRRIALTDDPSTERAPAVEPVSVAELGAALAWRGRRVEFTRMPLSDVAALFNSQNRAQLSIADRATATIPISGIFWSDDPEGLVRLLESGLGVRAMRSADTIVLSSR